MNQVRRALHKTLRSEHLRSCRIAEKLMMAYLAKTGGTSKSPKQVSYKDVVMGNQLTPEQKQQAQALYDLYEAGAWPKDVLNAVLNPKPAGDTSDSKKTIGGRIGDGVMCLFAGVSLFRP